MELHLATLLIIGLDCGGTCQQGGVCSCGKCLCPPGTDGSFCDLIVGCDYKTNFHRFQYLSLAETVGVISAGIVALIVIIVLAVVIVMGYLARRM